MATDEVSLVAVGDMVIQRPQPETALALVAPIFREADIAFCNLEFPLCDRTLPQTPFARRLKARCDPEMVEGIASVGFDFVGLANNHAMDYGAEGLMQTIALLEKKGIPFVGAGRNIKEARAPLILERKGTRIAFLAWYSGDLSGLKASAKRPGVAMMRVDALLPPPHVFPEELEDFREDIAAAKKQADLLIVSCHWGVSYTSQVSVPPPAIGHVAIDAGADLIIGHHAHVLQGIEVYKGKVIFYSLSNFIFDAGVAAMPTETVIAQCSISDKRIEKVSFLPVGGIQGGQPRLLSGDSEEGQKILSKMDRLSRGLGTALVLKDGEAIVPVN